MIRFVAYGLGRVSSLLVQAVNLALLARSLGVDMFGFHAAALSLCYLYLMVVDFGLNVRALRLSLEFDARIANALLRLRSLTFIPLIALAAYSQMWFDHAHTVILAASVILVMGDSIGDLASSILLGIQKSSLAGVLLFSRRAVGCLPFVFGLSFDSAVASLSAMGLTGAVTAVSVGMSNRSRSFFPLVELIRTSASYWGTSLASSMQRSDTFIISLSAGGHLAGLYGAAARLANPVNVVTSMAVQLSVPDIAAAKSASERARRVRRLHIVVTSMAILLFCGSSVSYWATPVILGKAFSPAWPVVMGVLVGSGISAVAQGRLALHIATAVPRALARDMLCAVAVGLVLLAVAARAGTWGVSAGFVMSNVLVVAAVYRHQIGSVDVPKKGFQRF